MGAPSCPGVGCSQDTYDRKITKGVRSVAQTDRVTPLNPKLCRKQHQKRKEVGRRRAPSQHPAGRECWGVSPWSRYCFYFATPAPDMAELLLTLRATQQQQNNRGKGGCEDMRREEALKGSCFRASGSFQTRDQNCFCTVERLGNQSPAPQTLA